LDQQKREQEERDRQRREQEQRNTPRNVSDGQVSWNRSPRIAKDQLLKLMSPEDGTKVVNLEITADANGNITNVRVIQSSGNSSLDSYVVKQTQSAKFKAYKENGTGVPFKIRQDFALSVSKK
jgi:protein TonB